VLPTRQLTLQLPQRQAVSVLVSVLVLVLPALKPLPLAPDWRVLRFEVPCQGALAITTLPLPK
jgi:hypothetical protein